ncbi:hypothetical protein CBU03nite_38080 [Clostridium butyricum]|nr:hypothetical protein SC08_Contig83orf03816 [Clostridium butyricum]BBK75022.1 hypothetical protein Cbu04g_00300 [Clostridium butyricum]GEQ19190.1 hypothetical protein CBU01nite_38260 [Clostridium butyricum]GEQ27385.1 hypothetical protein CBU03nite_38080 [Clostridium butyricum]
MTINGRKSLKSSTNLFDKNAIGIVNCPSILNGVINNRTPIKEGIINFNKEDIL